MGKTEVLLFKILANGIFQPPAHISDLHDLSLQHLKSWNKNLFDCYEIQLEKLIIGGMPSRSLAAPFS